MKVVLHADGSSTLGAGHQVRMAALARALTDAGHEALLVGRDLPGSSHAWAWRGLPQRLLDVEDDLVDVMRAAGADAIVIDTCSTPPAALQALADVGLLAVLDDVPGRDLSAAAIVVNPWPGVSAADYDAAQTVLVGPGYALVRPELARARGPTPGGPTLVIMGATDAKGLLPRIVAPLLAGTPGRLAIVLGAEPTVPPHDRIDRHERLDGEALARLMHACSAGVLSASTVAVEAACVGLPFVAIELADDQARLAAGLRAAGVTVLTSMDLHDLPRALDRAAVPRDFVDGLGAARVAAALERAVAARRARPTRVALRPVTLADEDLLRRWRNQPDVRASMYTDHEIGADEHARWFRSVIADAARPTWIVVHGGKDVGVVNLAQLDVAQGRCHFGIYVAEQAARGGGVGTAAMCLLLREVFDARGLRRLCCEALATNQAARRLYESVGLRQEGVYREHVLKAGRPVDVVTMAMLREEWLAIRSALERRVAGRRLSIETGGAP